MKRFLISLLMAATFAAGQPTLRAADAPAPVRADPSVEQRLEDLEAYVNNSARVADGTNNVGSKLGTYDKSSFTPNPGPGHNAWQMTSAALVLFMTLPGLILFYGGLVRRKNILSVAAQCFFLTGMVTILWWVCGYSLVFHNGNNGFFPKWLLGSLDFAFLNGVDSSPNTDYSAWVSHNVFSMYQLMFAIITPGADPRSHCRAHEVLGDVPLHVPLDVCGLLPPGSHDLGNRWFDEWRV